ncbi:glutathione S-transferase N-terminal domain-containing protein, partial [Staphylococcus pseudintermedius]
MSPILYYGVPSGCSFGSIVALEWSGQPYRLARVNMPEDMQTELFAAINPVRETPALQTARGDYLAESLAILNHIGATQGALDVGI